MPQILVTTDTPDAARPAVLMNERISLPDLESDHFSERLLERLGWALLDADAFEQRGGRRAVAGRERDDRS